MGKNSHIVQNVKAEESLKPKPKKPKLDEDNLSQSDRALNFIASVSTFACKAKL